MTEGERCSKRAQQKGLGALTHTSRPHHSCAPHSRKQMQSQTVSKLCVLPFLQLQFIESLMV